MPGPVAVAAVEQQLTGLAALLPQRLAHRRQAGTLGLGHAVEPGDGQVVGHGQPARGGEAQRAEREDVRGAHDRRQPGRGGQELGCARLPRVHAVLEALDDRHAAPVDPGLGEAVAEPGQPVALYGVGHAGLPGLVGEAVVAARPQPHAKHPDAAVAQPGEVACEPERRRAVVHPDAVDALHADRLIAHNDRHRALQHGDEVRVVLAHRVDDEPVHARLVHRRDVGVLRAHRDQQQTLPRLLAGQREPFEEAGRGRVAEGVRQRLGEQQPDRACPTRAQRSGDRVRARVAQTARGLQHPGAQRGRELVGPVVGVRHGRAGDTELRGQRRQRGRPADVRVPGHGRTVTVQTGLGEVRAPW